MSQPFASPPFKRRIQPRLVQEAWQSILRRARPYAYRLRLTGQDMWRRGKRHPRAVGAVAGGIALTLIGAYALNATAGPGHSLCPASFGKSGGKRPAFALLMDSVSQASAGSKLEIRYDVCGLAPGSAYHGRIQLTQRPAGKRKPSVQSKPVAVSFKDKVSGVSSRHEQSVELSSAKPGIYLLELSVVDNQGRKRSRLQTIRVKPRS
jgi:hypothetical protein